MGGEVAEGGRWRQSGARVMDEEHSDVWITGTQWAVR